ncbi:MAG: alpha/beta hydrolase [Eubacterium sp.]|nr:alpha/beta hydrolase [Eubacterium sp.]
MLIISIIVVAAFILLFLILNTMAAIVTKGNRKTLEEGYERQKSRYDTTYYDVLEKTDYVIKGYMGYKIHVQFVKNSEPTDKYMILTHGYTDNRFGTLKYAWIYLELGFNCIIYDLRGHGLNRRTHTTYGVRESLDLCNLIKDAYERYPDIRVLGLHGESLGAATSLTSLKHDPKIDFIVEDCGFSNIEAVFREASSKIPQFIITLTGLGLALRYRLPYFRMRPIDALRGNKKPILFMHGQVDTLIRPHHAEEMFAVTEGPKDIHFFPEGTHAHSVLTAREEYKEYVRKFLTEIGII